MLILLHTRERQIAEGNQRELSLAQYVHDCEIRMSSLEDLIDMLVEALNEMSLRCGVA